MTNTGNLDSHSTIRFTISTAGWPPIITQEAWEAFWADYRRLYPDSGS